MRDRMERYVLLPFTMGCISESGIAVGMQKRSKLLINSTPTRSRGREKEDKEDEEYFDNEESLSGGENMKSPLPLLAIPRFQKLFKNFSQLFVYEEDKEEVEQEMEIEIGLPTDVKHVTHLGLDGCISSILSKSWNHDHAAEAEQDLIFDLICRRNYHDKAIHNEE